MARTKQCFSAQELPEVWLSQSQDSGRTSDNLGGKFYFTGDTIFSYGPHFPIAQLFDAPDGEQVILFTTRTHSVTTAGHVQLVQRATRNSPRRVVHCNYVTGFDMVGNVREFKRKTDALAIKHAAARKPELYSGSIFHQARLAREYCEVMCIPAPEWAQIPDTILPGKPLIAALAVYQAQPL